MADMRISNEIEGLEGPNPVFRYPPRTAANGVSALGPPFRCIKIDVSTFSVTFSAFSLHGHDF